MSDPRPNGCSQYNTALGLSQKKVIHRVILIRRWGTTCKLLEDSAAVFKLFAPSRVFLHLVRYTGVDLAYWHRATYFLVSPQKNEVFTDRFIVEMGV